MRGHEAALREAGAQVVYVSTGAPGHAAAFRVEHGLTGAVLSDPPLAAFAAAGMARGLGALLRPRTVANAVRALRAGFRQRAVQGDPMQQGGVLVFGADGAVLAHRRDVGAGDLLDVAVVLDAVS